MTIEEKLTAAFRTADLYQPSPDLFSKVSRSIQEDAAHHKRVRRIAMSVVAACGFIALYLALAVDQIDGALVMPFWTLEVLVTGVMIALVLVLGPAIRRFGNAFESDIFRLGPSTGRGFLTLIDIAYYLIFGAFTFMTLQYSTPIDSPGTTQDLAAWLGYESWRVAGLLMLMGLLHTVTLVVLPAVGLVFSANTRRAHRAQLGEAAPPANPHNEELDRWITIVVWIVIGLALLLAALNTLPLLIGLGG
ncbi:MAG: hypothetical protein P1T08_17150 [Acidimicrobiia bacterium]|nr:hypothetical protein [Acidimicrobiia bacterium]